MAYKRYFYRNGKRFGPYYYESYRDNSGKVKKRYIGTTDPDEKKYSRKKPNKKTVTPTRQIFILSMIFILVALSFFVVLSSFQNTDVYSTQNFISALKEKATNPIKLIGLTIEETTTEQPTTEQTPQTPEETTTEQPQREESQETTTEETTSEESTIEQLPETQLEEQTPEETTTEPQETQTPQESTDETIPEEPVNETTSEESQQTQQEETETNDTITQIPEETEQENETVAENETTPEEPQENIEEENEAGTNETVTLPEFTLNETETNVTLNYINLTINLTDVNLTINETNFSFNETIFNETNITINETEINFTETNLTEHLNITTLQYRAVIGKPVKWVTTIVINKTQAERNNVELKVELPKDAENITIKTGSEVKEAKRKAEESINQIEDPKKSLITGEVITETENKGIITKIWAFFTGLSITGNVIQENEIQITEKPDKKEVNIEEAVQQEQEEEAEIAIEFETPAPTATETEISRGKQVTVSADHELNYINILAFTQLDNRININDTDKIKIYHLKTIEETTNQRPENYTTKEKEAIISNVTNLTIQQNITEEHQNQVNISDVNLTINSTETEFNETNISASLLTGHSILNVNQPNKTQTNLTETNTTEEIKIVTKEVIVKEEVNFTAYDLDLDGFIDYIEWTVPHLSEQVYEIIYISKAEHYDQTGEFIKDVFEEVRYLDDNYTLIPENHTLRVTFEEQLDSTKDITIYARAKNVTECYDNETQILTENGWKYFL
jgi:hypothetical protein